MTIRLLRTAALASLLALGGAALSVAAPVVVQKGSISGYVYIPGSSIPAAGGGSGSGSATQNCYYQPLTDVTVTFSSLPASMFPITVDYKMIGGGGGFSSWVPSYPSAGGGGGSVGANEGFYYQSSGGTYFYYTSGGGGGAGYFGGGGGGSGYSNVAPNQGKGGKGGGAVAGAGGAGASAGDPGCYDGTYTYCSFGAGSAGSGNNGGDGYNGSSQRGAGGKGLIGGTNSVQYYYNSGNYFYYAAAGNGAGFGSGGGVGFAQTQGVYGTGVYSGTSGGSNGNPAIITTNIGGGQNPVDSHVGWISWGTNDFAKGGISSLALNQNAGMGGDYAKKMGASPGQIILRYSAASCNLF